jgi:DNA-binding winged helix-turn-helix (wHTH) protein/tetratricopeptide (TPR) repeat protein
MMIGHDVLYEFGPFRVDPRNRVLSKSGRPLQITPLALNTLIFLVENCGRLVTKSELVSAIWPDTSVGDPNLASVISVVRKALGDSGDSQRYIKTVAKSGYRFVAPVHRGTAGTGLKEDLGKSPVPPAVLAAAVSADSRASRKTTVLLGLLVCAMIGGFFLARINSWLGTSIHSKPVERTMEMPAAGDRKRVLQPSSLAPFVSGQALRSRSEALGWYLKGRYSWSRGTEQGLKRSILYFNNALSGDPGNALAYAGLADAFVSLAAWSGQSSELAYRHAKDAAERAVQADDSSSEAHSALGNVSLIYDWNFSVAEREFKRAIKLAPSDAIAHFRFGEYLAVTGKLTEAVKEMQTARDLDPLSLNISLRVATMHYYSRQYREAMAEIKNVIDLDPHYSFAHYLRGLVYFVQQDFSNAASEFEESLRQANEPEPQALALCASARTAGGHVTAARAALDELLARSRKEYVSPFALAVLYIQLEDRDRAFAWIDRILQDHSTHALYLGVDPVFDPVRSDPQFASLMRRVNPNARSFPVALAAR